MFKKINSASQSALTLGLLTLLRSYRAFISPWLPSRCRFYPSCSCYAIEAIVSHGPLKGVWLMLHRLLRCHPFHSGGLDFVPNSKKVDS